MMSNGGTSNLQQFEELIRQNLYGALQDAFESYYTSALWVEWVPDVLQIMTPGRDTHGSKVRPVLLQDRTPPLSL